MANGREKKKLTSKQARRSSLLISTIISIGCIILVSTSNFGFSSSEHIIKNYLIICMIIFLTILCYFAFYFFVFKGDEIELEEDNRKIEDEIKQSLSEEDFTEVYYTPKNWGREIEMVEQIFKEEDIKFFAKLMENNNNIIIAKDKHNEEVFKTEIANFVYFKHIFKLRKKVMP